MNNTKKKSSLITGIAVLVISLVLTAGVKLIFPACGQHDDNGVLTYGSCHWAEQAVFAAGLILIIQSVVLVIARKRNVQAALSITIGLSAVITALIPQNFIKLCMMPSMRCIAVMQPCVIICCVILALLCIINGVMNRK